MIWNRAWAAGVALANDVSSPLSERLMATIDVLIDNVAASLKEKLAAYAADSWRITRRCSLESTLRQEQTRPRYTVHAPRTWVSSGTQLFVH